MTTILPPEARTDEQNKHGTIRVVKLITLPAERELPKVVVASKYLLMTIERSQTAKLTQGILPAQNIHEV